MVGYIYISATGVDPGAGNILTDPLFGRVPTLGACRPDIRRVVEKGDWIFVISGRKKNLSQYLIGGLRVEEKIDAIAAYNRLPENRMHLDEGGHALGNIPVDSDGRQHRLDAHSPDGFEKRAQNYIIGDRSVELLTPEEVSLAREQTLRLMAEIRGKDGNRLIDIMGRQVKISPEKVERVLDWFGTVKQVAYGQSRE